MVFNANSNKALNTSFHFELFKERIPPCESLKFLGITFDLGLSFNEHIKDVKKKCINRLNIIKLMSNKRYKLNTSTLKTIYLSLIRSIMDYSSLIIPQIAKYLGRTIQSTQNTAMKIIHKLKFDTHTDEVVQISGLPLIKERANELNINYIKNSIKYKNELVMELIKDYKDGSKSFKNKTFFMLV